MTNGTGSEQGASSAQRVQWAEPAMTPDEARRDWLQARVYEIIEMGWAGRHVPTHFGNVLPRTRGFLDSCIDCLELNDDDLKVLAPDWIRTVRDLRDAIEDRIITALRNGEAPLSEYDLFLDGYAGPAWRAQVQRDASRRDRGSDIKSSTVTQTQERWAALRREVAEQKRARARTEIAKERVGSEATFRGVVLKLRSLRSGFLVFMGAWLLLTGAFFGGASVLAFSKAQVGEAIGDTIVFVLLFTAALPFGILLYALARLCLLFLAGGAELGASMAAAAIVKPAQRPS